jgi:undecaprenyl-diphosphatase
MKKSKNRKVKKISKFILAIIAPIIIGLSFLLDNIIIKLTNVIQQPAIFTFFYIITLLGETYIFALISVILIAILLLNRRPIIAFLLTLGLSGIIAWLLKIIIQKPRPFETLNISSTIATNFSSFPSGHTMMFFAIIPTMSKKFPKVKILFWTIATLVGISRIYLGVHYFSDVIAGAIFGYTIGWICMKCGEKYEWKY